MSEKRTLQIAYDEAAKAYKCFGVSTKIIDSIRATCILSMLSAPTFLRFANFNTNITVSLFYYWRALPQLNGVFIKSTTQMVLSFIAQQLAEIHKCDVTLQVQEVQMLDPSFVKIVCKAETLQDQPEQFVIQFHTAYSV